MSPKNSDSDKKYYRILKILNLLNDPGRIKVAELAREFNVSVRSIQRDIERINMTFGLMETAKGEYIFAPGVSLKDMKLSNAQLSAMIMMKEMFKNLGGSFKNVFDDIFKKLTSGSPWDSPYWAIMPETAQDSRVQPIIKDLEYAVENRKKINMDYAYDGKTVNRRIHPLKIIFSEGFSYIFAKPEDKPEFRKYRIDKIKRLEVAAEEFTPPGAAKLEKILKQATNIWFTRERKIKILLQAEGPAVDIFRKKKFLPLQKIVGQNKDGSIIIEARLSQYMEAIPYILQWLPAITVVSPRELREEIHSRVRRYLEPRCGADSKVGRIA